ncbi:MAG: alpha/beta hydrolase [Dehalococcoidia bacterium]|nr:MAG: alpha/beta hydrolase [Dehalococcoidia bacterium]
MLMHGFPDDLHLYDELVPELAGRRVIAFDFLGWGQSDKPPGRAYTADSQTRDVAAVLDYFQLDQAVLVVHDASGPPGIDWALDHPERVAKLVLLNTYYSLMPTLRAPEAITLYSTHDLKPIADMIAASTELNRDLYFWQVGRFIENDELRARLVPEFYQRWLSAFPAFRSLNQSVQAEVAARTAHVDRLRNFPRPVQIIFGADDPYLNRGVAQSFHELFPRSELILVDGAAHYVQVDAPAQVARALMR